MPYNIPLTSLSISAHFEDILTGRPSGPLLFMVPSKVFVVIFFACRQSNIILETKFFPVLVTTTTGQCFLVC